MHNLGQQRKKYSNTVLKRAYDKGKNQKDFRIFFALDVRRIGVGTSRTRNVQGGNWAQPKMSYSYHPQKFQVLCHTSV